MAGENGPKAAAQRKSRMKKLKRLGVEAATDGRRYKASYDAPATDVEEVQEDEVVSLSFPDPGDVAITGDRPLLRLVDVDFAYPALHATGLGPTLLKGVNLEVTAGSRIALLGRNGAGKSTQARWLRCCCCLTCPVLLTPCWCCNCWCCCCWCRYPD